MGNDELLNSISDMMDEKFGIFAEQVDEKIDALGKQVDERFDSVNKRLDYIEFKEDRTAKQLSDLQLNIQIKERDIRKDLHNINNTIETLVEVLRIHDMLPQ